MRSLVLAEVRARLAVTLSLALGGFALMFVIGVTPMRPSTPLLGGAGEDASAALDAFGGPGGTESSPAGGGSGWATNHPIMLVIAMASGVAIGSGSRRYRRFRSGGDASTRPVRREAFLAAAVARGSSASSSSGGARAWRSVPGTFMAPIRAPGSVASALRAAELLALGAFVGAIRRCSPRRCPGRRAGRRDHRRGGCVAYPWLMPGLSASLDWLRCSHAVRLCRSWRRRSAADSTSRTCSCSGLAGLAYLAALGRSRAAISSDPALPCTGSGRSHGSPSFWRSSLGTYSLEEQLGRRAGRRHREEMRAVLRGFAACPAAIHGCAGARTGRP